MANESIRSTEKAAALIAALEDTGSYSRAARKCRVSRSAFQAWRFDDPEFYDACKAAKQKGMDHRRDEIEDVFLDVAKNPKHPQFVTAAIFALKNLASDQYRDRQDHTHSGPDGEALTILLAPRSDGPQ